VAHASLRPSLGADWSAPSHPEANAAAISSQSDHRSSIKLVYPIPPEQRKREDAQVLKLPLRVTGFATT
jgi:hypothetical protein